MSLKERRLAQTRLQRLAASQGSRGCIFQELQVMLMLNIRAEIEILDGFELGLCGWLKQRLESNASYSVAGSE